MLGGMLGNVVDEISGKNKSGGKIKGKVVLMNKSVLNINDLLSLQSATTVVNSAYDQLLGQQVSLQLISSENADSENGNKGKLGKPVSLQRWSLQLPSPLAKESWFAVSFDLDEEFGTPGAIVIRNNQASEFYLKNITLDDVNGAGQIHFVCNSWIYPDNRYKKPRIFFSNKSYVPHEMPALLRKHREEELEVLRGDGKTELKTGDRVYDYDTYNDLGDPDWNSELARPELGGTAHLPYPRRGRTSRPPSRSGKI
ncbi:Lipoxygenase [Corchorus capsularis]|uniref:Lipoxygenase n=1 Tax=Corchorus capsularis TaxID=210143 RepID=A0A1R3J3A9_COCAP|nr:Lipoxygenase [Corchorus capsularis]